MSHKSVILSHPNNNNNVHSYKQEVAYRRERVFTWIASGKHPREIAAELILNEKTIKRDLHYLMGVAKQEIKSYVEQRLPWEYQKSLAVLDEIKRRAFELADKSEINRDKIMALRLAAEAETSKARLLAEGPGVVALQDIQNKVNRLESQQFSQSIRQQIPLTR
jgi:hypothetical protein